MPSYAPDCERTASRQNWASAIPETSKEEFLEIEVSMKKKLKKH